MLISFALSVFTQYIATPIMTRTAKTAKMIPNIAPADSPPTFSGGLSVIGIPDGPTPKKFKISLSVIYVFTTAGQNRQIFKFW